MRDTNVSRLVFGRDRDLSSKTANLAAKDTCLLSLCSVFPLTVIDWDFFKRAEYSLCNCLYSSSLTRASFLNFSFSLSRLRTRSSQSTSDGSIEGSGRSNSSRGEVRLIESLGAVGEGVTKTAGEHESSRVSSSFDLSLRPFLDARRPLIEAWTFI